MFVKLAFGVLIMFAFSKVYAQISQEEVKHLQTLPGHLKPFGFAGPFFSVPEVNEFPSPFDFFNKYVVTSIPVVIKGAAKLSDAFTKWSDEYFLEHPGSALRVFAEGRKKEIRTGPGEHMSFHKFVEDYKTKDMYLVSSVPEFLRSNVIIPPSLNCDAVLKDGLNTAVMWFSSGGTKSVLHNDDMDNINCLYRGNKTLTFVSPFHTNQEWLSKVLDHPEGSYSDLDVDAVDFVKYPELANMRYGIVHMKAGDCLYIPWKWVHQVNSFGNNLAINIWLEHLPLEYVDLTPEKCGEFQQNLTLDKVKFKMLEPYDQDSSEGSNKQDERNEASDKTETSEDNEPPSSDIMIDVYMQAKQGKSFNIEDIKEKALAIRLSTRGFNSVEMLSRSYSSCNEQCEAAVKRLFSALDANKDDLVDVKDLKIVRKPGRKNLREKMMECRQLMEDIFTALDDTQFQAERALTKKMVERGYVDMKLAKVIYGEKFLAGLSLKDEL